MKKTFLLFAMAGALLSSCGGGNKAPKDNESAKESGAKVRFNVELYDLGLIDHDTLLNKQFTIYNDGTENLVIERVESHCGCTLPVYFQKPIAPGDSAYMTVALETRALEIGYFNKSVDVYTNGSDKPIPLTLKGEFVRKPNLEKK